MGSVLVITKQSEPQFKACKKTPDMIYIKELPVSGITLAYLSMCGEMPWYYQAPLKQATA